MVQSEISTHGTWKHFNSEYLSPIIIFFTTIQINQTIAHPFEKNIFEIESKPMPMRMYAACSWVFLAALLSLSFCRPGQRSIEVSSHQAKGQMEDGRSIFSRHTQENGDQKGVQCPQHNVVNDHLGRGVLFYISIAYQTLPATRE